MWFLDVTSMHFAAGEEEGRQVGTSSADPSRRRSSRQSVSAGTFTRQKSPAGNDSASKDAMVSSEFNCSLLLCTCFTCPLIVALRVWVSSEFKISRSHLKLD